ncbi:hypothetical protein GCM10018781_59230 [Kitasatospora indigofera]|uniref:DUF5667 domain-containing protein n=1 Tax=Kitasatospora indigofera TaxID=67307 RepID=A0A919G933_9ACTN|nr:DUF5667 domain-containing protein [Kitasatospora indigofera]GHH79994.1 hypothetical protein GCM10018781_59230 [Kitasatospora indigofera]
MTANVLEHRRAKAFAEALEAHQVEHRDAARPAEATADRGDAMAVLLGMADSLGALPGPELDPEVRTVQRAQLMAAFEQAFTGGAGAGVPRQRRSRAHRTVPRGRWSRRFAIGGLVAGIAVGSFAGAAAASTNALPGDTLYGMKRGLEGLQLDFAGSDSERGALLLDQASTRLGEAKGLLGRAGSPSALNPDTVEQVRRALADMHAEAIKGRELLRSVYRSNGSLEPMRMLAGFAEDEDGRWSELQSRLPVQLTQEAGRVDRLFDDISEDVAPLRLTEPSPRAVRPTAAGRAASTRAVRPTAGRPAATRPAAPAARSRAPRARRPRPARPRAAPARRARHRATPRRRSAAWSTAWPTASPARTPRRARTPPPAPRQRPPARRATLRAASRVWTSRRSSPACCRA